MKKILVLLFVLLNLNFFIYAHWEKKMLSTVNINDVSVFLEKSIGDGILSNERVLTDQRKGKAKVCWGDICTDNSTEPIKASKEMLLSTDTLKVSFSDPSFDASKYTVSKYRALYVPAKGTTIVFSGEGRRISRSLRMALQNASSGDQILIADIFIKGPEIDTKRVAGSISVVIE